MIWLAIIACLLVSFVFSGIEAGILSVNRVRLKHRVKMRDPAALKLNRLLAQPERLLVSVLVVTNLMNITAVVLTAQALVARFGWKGYPATLAVFLPVYLVGLEVLPKSLFRRFPYRALAAFFGPLRLANTVLAPMAFLGWRVTHAFLRNHQPSGQPKLFAAREDFKYLTFESERTGTLTRTEREMIHNVVDFRAITARDVMVPMADARMIQSEATIEELVARHAATGFDRWPVVSEKGEITGLVDIFDIAVDKRRRGRVEPFQRRIVKVRENEPAYAVLRKLRAARVSIAAVLDGAGKPIGIVSSEDLVRRLVGAAKASA